MLFNLQAMCIGSVPIPFFENEKHDANQATVLMIESAFEVAGARFKEGGVFPPEAKGDG